MKRNNFLTCKEEIKVFLAGTDCGAISDYMFRKYIKMGMPALFNGREWVAHVDNIDEWFKAITRKQMRDEIDEIVEEE